MITRGYAAALGAVAALSAVSTAPAQTIDLLQARTLAAACANCHGTDGVSQAALPGLAGRSREDIASTMKAFKAGTRPATIMHQLARGYTDEQIDAIAAYFAAVKVRK